MAEVTRNLAFNILTFTHSSEEYTFYFSNLATENSARAHSSIVPSEVIEHFGKQEHYYVQYLPGNNPLFPVTKKSKPTYLPNPFNPLKPIKDCNSAFSNALLKRYYIFLITRHFNEIGIMSKPNFVDDIQIWLPSKNTIPNFRLFEKYALKVQFAMVTKQPELQVTYEGQSKVFNKSLALLMNEVPPNSFNWMIFNNQLYKYEALPNDARLHFDKVFPVLNFGIRDALKLPVEAPDRSNHYVKYKTHITHFFDTYLNTDTFKAAIAIDCPGFIPVNEKKIGTVTANSNTLLFNNEQQHVVPYKGMDKYGPLELPEAKRIQFFYIFHESHLEKVKQLNHFFEKGMHSFKGMYGFVKVPFYTSHGFSIAFKNKDNPVPEIENVLRLREFSTDIQYIAIYITPHSKNSSDKQHRLIYYRIKEILLKRNITSQAIEESKIKDDNFYAFSLNNISIAILAKLNGVPWRLNVKLKNELIVGIGAFRNLDTDTQYIGSAFSFSNNGHFNRFECFMKNQVRELAGSIIRAVKEFTAVQSTLTRLIIHFYKQMNSKELDQIEDSLLKLGLNIPVYIVTINKTESEDIIAFDSNWHDLMPESGLFISIGHQKYLLFNNTRYPNANFNPSDGYPFPIKLSINCTKPELVDDYKVVKELIDQVYQFSRMYWKSVRQQNLPVTIKYPELVAEMFPHFEGTEIPDFGKDNLWFL